MYRFSEKVRDLGEGGLLNLGDFKCDKDICSNLVGKRKHSCGSNMCLGC